MLGQVPCFLAIYRWVALFACVPLLSSTFCLHGEEVQSCYYTFAY